MDKGVTGTGTLTFTTQYANEKPTITLAANDVTTFSAAWSATDITGSFQTIPVCGAQEGVITVTVTAVTGGEMTSGAVISIPSLDDGVYTLKVFVWDDGMCPIKDVKSLGE